MTFEQNGLFPIGGKLPEIGFRSYRIIVSLMLPEGYTVEELPKSQRLSACDEGIACTMQLQQQGALMQCLFEFDLSRIIFPATEYTDLSAFYGFVMDMCNSRIVLKKS